MKQLLLALTTMLAAHAASAAKLQPIPHVTNAALEKLSVAGSADPSLLQNNFKVVSTTPPDGRSAAVVRMATVAQAAHSLCGFFDDGVELSLVESKQAASAVTYLSSGNVDDNDVVASMASALTAAAGPQIEIYSGDASGNNTAGTVLGVYDLSNNEILVFSSTNCGSDD